MSRLCRIPVKPGELPTGADVHDGEGAPLPAAALATRMAELAKAL